MLNFFSAVIAVSNPFYISCISNHILGNIQDEVHSSWFHDKLFQGTGIHNVVAFVVVP